MKIRKLSGIFLALSLLNLITIFTAPFLIPPGTIQNCDGNANVIDNFDQWERLNPYSRLIYTIGDFNCHQKASRSFYLNDNQMPVCARDTGLAIGFMFGSLLFVMMIPDPNPIRMAGSSLFKKKALKMSMMKLLLFTIFFGIIFFAPMVIDGLLQIVSDYESTNPIRFITGLTFGLAFIVSIGAYLESYIYKNIYMKKDSKLIQDQ